MTSISACSSIAKTIASASPLVESSLSNIHCCPVNNLPYLHPCCTGILYSLRGNIRFLSHLFRHCAGDADRPLLTPQQFRPTQVAQKDEGGKCSPPIRSLGEISCGFEFGFNLFIV